MRQVTRLLIVVGVTIPCVLSAGKLSPEVERAIAHGAEAKIRLKVYDDGGAPVSNASVRAFFDMLPEPHSTYGKTDTNGICVVKGKTNGNKIRFLVGKEGYYGSRKGTTYIEMGKEHDVKDGKWQPYGADEIVELRKIRNPTHLSVAFMREFTDTKTTNTWLGFDFDKRDYVRPYGKGEVADFEVFFDWDGRCFADYRGMGLKIRFVDKFSGYYQCNTVGSSDFKWPYAALPDASYRQDADFFTRVIVEDSGYGRRYERRHFDRDKCWVVRSRCKVDEEGNLVSAHYSVVNNIEFAYEKGGVAGICIMGAFNPTPSDTNLEDVETVKRSRGFIRQCEPPAPQKKRNLLSW